MRADIPSRRALGLVTAGLLSGLVLAGCGSDDSPSDSAAATTTAAKTATDLPPAVIDEVITYTKGTEGPADTALDPVVVGVVNQQGGVPAFPEYLDTAELTAKFINEQLGGVDGHPLELQTCIVQSEEDGQKCASEFLTKKVPIAIWTLGVLGNQSFYKTLNGKIPVVVSAPATGADTNTPHVYSLDGGASATLVGMAELGQKDGAKTVAIVSDDSDAGKFTAGTVLVPLLKKLGVTAKAAYYPAAGTQPEMVSALQAAGATKADGVMFLGPTPSHCLSAYKALEQLGVDKPVYGSVICTGDDFVTQTDEGQRLSDWAFVGLAGNARVEDDPQPAAFQAVMDAYGQGSLARAGHVLKTFGDLLTIDRWSNEIGADKLSPAAYEDAIKAWRGPGFGVPGELRCGTNEAEIGVCGSAVPVSAFRDGRWQRLADITPGS